MRRERHVHTRKLQDRHIAFSGLDVSFGRTYDSTLHEHNIPETSSHLVGEFRGRGLDGDPLDEEDAGCPFGKYGCQDLELRWVDLLDIRGLGCE